MLKDIKLKFWRFHKFFFKQILKVSAFYLEKQKSIIPKNNFFREVHPKPSRKIESVNKAFLFWYWKLLKKYFFRNKTFLFFKIESWNFQNQFEKEFRETSQSFNSIRQPIEKNENNNCLNKLNELKWRPNFQWRF